MKDFGDKAQLLRIIGAGIILLLVLWTFLVPPAKAQKPGGAPAGLPPAAEPELPASDLLLRYESPVLSFRWSLAPEAALEPELVRSMRNEAVTQRETALQQATMAAETLPAGAPVRPAQWSERWHAEAETDGLLALSARQITYTGGAHSNMAFRARIWDRGAGRPIALAELFQNPGAAMAALTPPFCKALDAERAERRQGVALKGYEACPNLARSVLVPVGEGRIHSVRVLVPPYDAGPWSEGVYEILLDAALLRPHLAPRYAGAFSAP